MFEYLQPFSQFHSIKEMDEQVALHLYAHPLTPAERDVLLCISRHALHYPGVAHLRASTIAQKCKISTKTVYRAVKHLHEIGVVKKVPTCKMNGIKGASIYQILPYVPTEMSERNGVMKASNDNVSIENSRKHLFSFNQKLCSSNNYNNTQYEKWMMALFKDMPFREELKIQLPEVISSVPLQNMTQFTRAKQVLFKLLTLIQSGELQVKYNLRALYKGAYEKWVLADERRKEANKKQPYSHCPVPFYNWLEERE